MSKYKVELTANGTDFTFNVDLSDYNKFVNSIAGSGSKVQAAHNLCATTLAEDSDSDALAKLLALPGVPMQMAGEIVENVTADVDISLKKSSKRASA